MGASAYLLCTTHNSTKSHSQNGQWYSQAYDPGMPGKTTTTRMARMWLYHNPCQILCRKNARVLFCLHNTPEIRWSYPHCDHRNCLLNCSRDACCMLCHVLLYGLFEKNYLFLF